MSALMDGPPFAPRDERGFLAEMNALSRWHLEGCGQYRRMWPDWRGAETIDQLPFVHVGVFKHLLMQTTGAGVEHQRTLHSSSTSGIASQITLDSKSSELQAASTLAILKELVGPSLRPLVVLDDVKSLRQRGQVNARIAAAMSLKPLASDIQFVVDLAGQSPRLKHEQLIDVLAKHDRLLVYGFTWILWQAWAGAELPAALVEALKGKTIHFVHSGGWKKLEALKVGREQFDAALLRGLSPESRVIDYYGLVEQVGVIFPLCAHGFRHAPRWSAVLVRDPYTLRPIVGQPGMLQLMNPLAWGAPYHSVLTEDMGRVVEGPCPCGRPGTRFELLGRIPKAEVRGCANV